MGRSGGGLFWTESGDERARLLVVDVREFSNTRATSLSSTTFVAYPVHVVLLNFSYSDCAHISWIIAYVSMVDRETWGERDGREYVAVLVWREVVRRTGMEWSASKAAGCTGERYDGATPGVGG